MSTLAVSAKCHDGVAVISALNSTTKITFVGASCLASALPGSSRLDSVTLSPDKGVPAIVALITTYDPGAKHTTIYNSGVIELVWEKEKLIVRVNDDFISPKDRLIQVDQRGDDVLITTQGQVFGTCHDQWCSGNQYYDAKKKALLAKGVRIANDASLLCRYVLGQANLQELEAVASGDPRTAEQIQFSELQGVCSVLREALAVASQRYDARVREIIETAEMKEDQVSIELRATKQANYALAERNGELSALLHTANVLCKAAETKRDELQGKLDCTFGARFHKKWDSISASVRRGLYHYRNGSPT